MKRLVVAQYKEDVEWIKAALGWKVTVITKGDDLPNKGRESSSYLYFIIKIYPFIKPNDVFAFTQGDPFPHCPNILDRLQTPVTGYKGLAPKEMITDAEGKPNHPGVPVGGWYERWFNEDFPGELIFYPGCQFVCLGSDILKHSLGWYKAVYNDIMEDNNSTPYAFERIAPVIFGGEKYAKQS